MLPYLRTYYGSRYNRSNQAGDSLLPGSRSLIPSNSSSLSDPSAAPNNSSSQSVRSNELALAASSSGPLFSSASNSSFSSSLDRTSLLNQVIKRILSERPHLRLEDEQLLKLLAKKQGAAFESEIRNNLLLPKTSVWRLVRRLEREELIKVVKVDNQNLIKLKV